MDPKETSRRNTSSNNEQRRRGTNSAGGASLSEKRCVQSPIKSHKVSSFSSGFRNEGLRGGFEACGSMGGREAEDALGIGNKRMDLNAADSFYEGESTSSIDYNNNNYFQGDDRGSNLNEEGSQSAEEGRFIRRGVDGPKYVDLSTPTLVDEVDIYENEEEEKEMVKLEYERIRRNASAPIGSHASSHPMHYATSTAAAAAAIGMNLTEAEESVRRTPGAQMYRSTYDPSADSQTRSDRSDSFDRESMRRTPGASKMHASALLTASSASPTKIPQDAKSCTVSRSRAASSSDASGLGFGLTLTSPIAASERKGMDETRPPRPFGDKVSRPGFQQDNLESSGRNLYSPNTLRLTEDLGNLLLEDDDNSDETQRISQFVFRSGTSDKKHEAASIRGGSGVIGEGSNRHRTQTAITESWTTPFIVNMEQNQHQASRVPRNTHRGRKSRLDRTGRARGGIDRTGSTSLSALSSSSWNHRPSGAAFLPHAHQPTPLRKMQPQSLGSNRSVAYDAGPPDRIVGSQISGQPSSSFGNFAGQQQNHFDVDGPVLNFGGAFSPPAKLAGRNSSITAPRQQRSLPPPPPVTGSFLSGQGNSGFETPVQYPAFPSVSPVFDSNFSRATQRHQVPTPPPYFQGPPAFGPESAFQTVNPPYGESGHLHAPMFPANTTNLHPPMSHSPTFNFSHAPYPMNPHASSATIHNPHATSLAPTDFMVNVSAAAPQGRQQASRFVPSPQQWGSNLPMPYESMQASSALEQQYTGHGSDPYSNGWQMQQSPYRMHPQQQQAQLLREASPGVGAPTWGAVAATTPQDGEQVQQQQQQRDSSCSQQTTVTAVQQHRSPFVSASAVTGRPPSRGKNQRKTKNLTRGQKWASKNQQQKHHGADSQNDNKGFQQRTDTASSGAVGNNTQGNPATSSTTGKKSSAGSKGGKKKYRDRSTPIQGERPSGTPVEDMTAGASATDQAGSTVANAEAVEDPATAKRAELTESPATRSAFKDFYRKLRAEERTSFQDAEKFAMQSLSDGSLPESIHWRVYLELADLAKRSNRFEEARKLYQKVYQLQPYASQGWLEFSKLEEECGNMSACAKILAAGLEYCEYSESLLTRAIKHEEKRGNLGRAREFLARLKHVGIEKVWRTVLEGAMLEARAGNDVMARRVLKYLMHHVPWYGPLYLEAYKLEKDLGHSMEALAVVERGLAQIPRYGPLWFGAFRLCEELDLEEKRYRLPQSMAMIDRATLSISKELIWKVHLEAAQMLERSSTENLSSTTDPTFLQVMEMSRKRFALTIVSCPPNLRWKVWLAAGRMEVAAGNSDIARRLFLRAHRVVPDKGRAVALLECARLEEFVGDVELASAILCRSRNAGGSDWKVWLESVMLAIRNGDYTKAIALSQKALQQHSGTGRLWASLIQLRHLADVEEAQFESLTLALNAVPKSGEVWCEGARIHLNPFSRTFDLQRASRHLFFATKFTPQYGDGFLETLRLLVLDQLLVPISIFIWEESNAHLETKEDDDTWREGLSKFVFDILLELNGIRHAAETKSWEEWDNSSSLLGSSSAKAVIERLYSGKSNEFIDISMLELRCANADPNYGPLWFHCRSGPTETARNVLAHAVDLIVREVQVHAHLYIVALVRRCAVVSRYQGMTEAMPKEGTSSWEKAIDQELLSTPSLEEMIRRGTETMESGVELLESSIPPTNFIAGIAELSQHHPIQKLSLSERRKMLFGADSLFS